jgi:hypothetical protein
MALISPFATISRPILLNMQEEMILYQSKYLFLLTTLNNILRKTFLMLLTLSIGFTTTCPRLNKTVNKSIKKLQPFKFTGNTLEDFGLIATNVRREFNWEFITPLSMNL